MRLSKACSLLSGLFVCLLLLAPALGTPAQAKPKTPVFVYASPTLEVGVRILAVTFRHQTEQQVEFIFGPPSRLMEIIHKGGHLDLVLSDDAKLLDDLASSGMTDPATRAPVIGTTLVLAAPVDNPPKIELRKGFDLAHALKGNLAVVSLKSGPEGVIAKQAMEKFGWLDAMKGRFLVADDGKAAARAADRGQAGAALLYAPDVTWVMNIETVATFPADSHDPIVFEGVALKGAHPKAADFLAYIKSPKALEYFQNARFTALPPPTTKK
jgi:molybdate transport system substrate-binding protein